MKAFNSLKLSVKLPLIIVTLSLVAAFATGAMSYVSGRANVEAQARQKLEAVLENRSAALEGWLSGIREDAAAQAANPSVQDAISEFSAAWNAMGGDQETTLQRLYIELNPHPIGSKDALDAAADGGVYSALHAKYHPYFRAFLRARGYYDVFLFDADGNTVYTVFKEADFATNAAIGRWSATDLGAVFRAARDKAGQGGVAFSDFRAYAPSNNAPASFIAAPVKDRDGRFLGVVAFQMPIERMNALMQNTAGLGATGETYIVGADFMMRTNSRFSKESTILTRKVESPTVKAALAGERTLQKVNDYRNVPVFSAAAPIAFEGAAWAVIAEQDAAELLAPVNAMLRNLIVQLVLSMLILSAIGYFVSRGMTRPIAALTRAMGKIAGGDYAAQVGGAKRGDEIGAMAKTLLHFRDALAKNEETTRVALFKGAAFDGSNAAMMMVDRDFKVTFVNAATDQLFRTHRETFVKAWPNFDPDKIVGTCIDIFHKNPAHQRQMLADPSRLPYRTEITIGDLKIALNVSGVFDAKKNYVGNVLQWADVTAERMNAGILAAMGRAQAMIEFLPDGTIVSANENFLNTMGYSLQEIVGRHHSMFAAPDYAKSGEYRNFWETLRRGEYVAGQFTRIGKGGREVVIQGSYNPIVDGAGKAFKVVKFCTDLTAQETERRKVEAERAANARDQQIVVDGLAQGLIKLAEGDLTARITTEFSGDYETLRLNFNEATQKLETALSAVLANAGSMITGIGEISHAADDLSKRTEHQAATLEETAAALDEVTATVRQTAAGATQANAAVTETRVEAEQSGKTVRDAVVAMGEIEKSSSQISQIIGVIDEIAFQTNLLALNAGVEAARAGDAGRGFAVVASEVRALAQRSSDAAKEIKGLISASSQHVSTGVRLVGNAGTALEQIVSRVGEIAKLVSDIASSAQEQATGLAEINTAVNQMDQVTQQNAAMVEQSTAASHSLRQEAEELSRLVAVFQTDSQVASTPAPGPAKREKRASVAEQRQRAQAFATSGAAARKVASAPAEEADWKEF